MKPIGRNGSERERESGGAIRRASASAASPVRVESRRERGVSGVRVEHPDSGAGVLRGAPGMRSGFAPVRERRRREAGCNRKPENHRDA